MDVPGLLAQLLNGLQYGLLLFLIASGLTLIFGVMGVINLAHGSMFMIGAYLAYAVTAHGGSPWLAVPAAAAAGLLIGTGPENGLFRAFYPRQQLGPVPLTFGLLVLLEEGASAPVAETVHPLAGP